MTQRDEVQKFEHGRIKVLQEERLHIQKKTFTKWMNAFLQKARLEVDDLFTDLADGRRLLKLLEIISGEKLAKPNNGKMRVHKIENVNKSLAFLHTKVRLESIGAEDIVDCNPRLILGLIWTIILRFQIQEIEIDVDEENESSEKKSAKDALLLWAQRKTHGYPGVQINDFSNSWRSGLGFNALIHSHRPDLFEFSNLQPSKHIDNLNHAFDVANNELGIPRLLDAEDIDTNRPDEKSVMTYVASYYHTFARMKNEVKSGRRIEKIIKQMSEADKMKVNYDVLTSDLLEWIQIKIHELENRDFPNSLEGIQQLLLAFGVYRTREKPPKYKERSEIEALFFNINTQLKELKQPTFIPNDGKLLQDIERAWDQLERAEHSRELALRTELRRQERLQQLSIKFEKKSILRESYLKEMIQVLSDPIYGSNLAKVDATVKKHEAISADILAREERIHDLTQMCEELTRENYRYAEKIKERENKVVKKWKDVLALLDKHKVNLNHMGNVMSLLREIDTNLTTVYQLTADVMSVDTGVHLFAVEELLQKHALQELQVTSLEESEKRLKRLGEKIASQSPNEEEILKKKLNELTNAFKDLQNQCVLRRALLEEARNFYQFLQDEEEEEAWLIEKQRICLAGIIAKDLPGVLRLQQKHKLLMDEIKLRKNKFDQLDKTGMQLIKENHPRTVEIQQHIDKNKKEWETLEKLANERMKRLQDAAEAYQFYADANEADSFLLEKKSILSSKDYGSDEPSGQALLQRHKDLQGELNAYEGDIQSLNNQAEKLISSGISNLDLTAEPEVSEPVEEIVYETKLVPVEVVEEEPVEKIEHRTVIQERKVPQVKALYPFNDHGLTMAKGEIMYLLNKSNPDWWCVRKADGTDGFAPANYVQEIEPRIIQMKVNKPEKVKVLQKVKKTKMVPQQVPVKVMKAPKQLKPKVDDSNSVPKRQKKINETYKECQDMAVKRHALLEDAIRLFGFYRECDDFDRWMKDREKLLKVDDRTQNVEQAARKHKKFVTDLSASKKRLEGIEAEIKEFEKQNHSQIKEVRARYKQILSSWEKLKKLMAEKEKSLEGASIIEIFVSACEEAKERMEEKLTHLDSAVLGVDLKTVQALQRRHEQLEREITPIEKTVNDINSLATSVKSSNPQEAKRVAKKEEEIKELWAQVKVKALDRRNGLENAVGQQIFTNSSQSLLAWVANIKKQLNADNSVRDVQTAEGLLKNHQDLGEEIKARNDEFQQLTDLGDKLLVSNPNLSDVTDKINRLNEEQAAIQRGWKEKQNWLHQCLKLQKFNKEADKIDAATSSHLAFLEFSDLGNSLDEVEALLKQHRAFENTLMAQESGISTFNKTADVLINEKHYYSQGIDDKRNQVLQRRQVVKENSQSRSNVLENSKMYQEFCAQVSDLKAWLAEKLKTASDESYRDLNNLKRKLQKHEAFERELRANEGQLRLVNKMGQALIAQDSYRKDDVAQTLKDLNDEWQKLVGISYDKGRKLRQAENQYDYNIAIEDVNIKLNEIDKKLKSTHVGTDMRSCKDLLKKHEMIESELTVCSHRVKELENTSKEMMHNDHFDSAAIKKKVISCQNRQQSFSPLAKTRREALEEALKFHVFNFELDNELQWIKEHMPQASSDVLGQNLHQAQNLYKKHKKLENEIVGHQPVIDKTLESGQSIIGQHHPEANVVKELCTTLKSNWNELKDKAAERDQKLELSLKAQEYFFETNEVESWLNERKDILQSNDAGRDRDAATKLLTKHKALELGLDTYSNIIAEMGRGAQALIQSGHPEAKAINERQASLEHLVRSLQRKAAIRQQKLMESLFRHEYFLESEELERWIVEQYQQASSEDYGQDYEHLLFLQARFDDFKHSIEAGSERFRQCEDLAQKLINNESPYTTDIEKKQHQLEDYWEKLKQQIDNRDKKLKAAGEVHRFHRDVGDAISRIHGKSASLGNELGRDLNSALSLLRKQEAFENELVVLEAQLQVLIDDASRIKALYPNNKSKVEEKQNLILREWQNLKDFAEIRKERLQANVDLQKYLTLVRDLTNWSVQARLGMEAHQENIRDTARAQTLKDEHDALKGEIDAREDLFNDVKNMATAMDQTDHYAAPEAVEKCNALFQEHDKLHRAWLERKIYLEQLIDLHVFLREAQLLEDISNSQEVALLNMDFGESVEEVARAYKKHEEFEKILNTQDEKFENLLETVDKLRSQNHFESGKVAKCLAEVQSKREKIKALSFEKKRQLEHALLYAEFVRDVADVKNWIGERNKKLQGEIKTGDVSSLEDKIKKLQKHQAFEAEVAAHLGRVKQVKEKGETLIAKNHRASQEIAKQLSELDMAWMKLAHEVSLRGKGLEEAQDILEFNNQLDKIETWIRDKEVMVQAADTGRDYEHCQALQRKLDDVDSDMRVDDTRIKTINLLANKLIKQSHPGVQERRDNFIKKWHNLQGALNDYRNKLGGAAEVHLFIRNVADTCERINEKVASMEIDDVGKDVNGVQALQRKQEAAEMEMIAVENKLRDHDKEFHKLSAKYPQSEEVLTDKMEDLHKQWVHLSEAKRKRKYLLDDAYTKHKFLSDTKDLEIWQGEVIKRMESRSKSNSVAEAEALLELHNEIKVEINGRADEFNKLIAFGQDLGNKDTSILKAVERLQGLQKSLLHTWNQHQNDLLREYRVQEYKEQAEILERWLSTKEAFLNNDDIGENPRAVETLIRKHQDFETTLIQQLIKVTDLKDMADILCRDEKYDHTEVKSRMQHIINRKNNLIKAMEERKIKLDESKSLHEFIRNIHEVETWLAQKYQIANDENYRDPTNLQTKIQKHVAFEAEIYANNNRIQDILQEGQTLISNEHFASAEIQKRIEELESDWKLLQETSQLKKDRLSDAYQALLFNRSLDEFENWLSEIEQQLQSRDFGKDLASVNNLLKKHLSVVNDIEQHGENCEAINETCEQFIKNEHFMVEDLQNRAQDSITRYHQLQDPMQARRDLLEASNMLHQFTRDVDDELQWLIEREPIAASKDLGNTLTAVQSLQKKHQALESELLSREPIVGSLVSRAAHLTRSGHNSADLINEKAVQLKTKLAQIRDLASIRRLRLQDALEAQSYYAEASEAEAWIRDKKPLIQSAEVGKDEDTAQSLQRKLEAISCEIQSHKSTIQRLHTVSKKLEERNHFDAENIKQKQIQIERKFQELENLLQEREICLNEALLYFGFIRECNDVLEWMGEQQVKAGSEDYGNDVEHVELLMQAFETFSTSLSNMRVQACIDKGSQLIASESRHSAQVQQKVEELKTQWDDLLELAQARRDALHGAKRVHMFDRTADETITWINEKDTVIELDNSGHDLESIQALVRKHATFESELLALKEQVDYVENEAKNLIEMYPDTEEHIQVKREDTLEAWKDLYSRALIRKDNLKQSEHLQAYYDQYQEFIAWINEMLAKITAPDLPQDVTSAEILIEKHKEYKVEIDARTEIINDFFKTGNNIIKKGHFLSHEIQNRIKILERRLDVLHNVWGVRSSIYEQNFDVQLFKREANTLENWLIIREGTLKDSKVGDSITQVEDLIKKHDDFENTIRAQEEKFNALKRITLLEEAFALQKEMEAKARKEEIERQELERMAQRKKVEMQRITELRRQEEQRDRQVEVNGNNVNNNINSHKTQEIVNETPTSALTKSNSVAHMFADRIRRGSDHSIKRAESMKVTGPKLPKRTPSFTTRRRGSIRNKNTQPDPDLIEIEGFIDRKQVLTAGKKKAQNRTWKNLYTVLCGQLLCFFKNRDDFCASKALYAPLVIHNANCSVADDYSKKKHTFRIIMLDQSEYLFSCNSEKEMQGWVNKISFRAKLPPSQQLLHFEVQKPDYLDVDLSSQSSRTSSPDVTDNVVLRHDPQYSNGNSIHGHRHTFAGESPPPLPISQPPNNVVMRHHNTLENNGENNGDSRHDWTTNRPMSIQTGERKSSRIMDLFRKRRQPSSHM